MRPELTQQHITTTHSKKIGFRFQRTLGLPVCIYVKSNRRIPLAAGTNGNGQSFLLKIAVPFSHKTSSIDGAKLDGGIDRFLVFCYGNHQESEKDAHQEYEQKDLAAFVGLAAGLWCALAPGILGDGIHFMSCDTAGSAILVTLHVDLAATRALPGFCNWVGNSGLLRGSSGHPRDRVSAMWAGLCHRRNLVSAFWTND